MSLKILKQVFISIAYIAYATSTILKNQLHFDLSYYEYIFVAIIGICLKLSQHTDTIEKIIHEIPTDELKFIHNRLDSIVEMSKTGSVPPSIETRDTRINIPYPENEDNPSDIATHRSIELSNGNILRIPYQDNEDDASDIATHRSIELSNGNILRIHK